MFGRGKTQKSANDRFVMAMGMKAGNLSAPKVKKKAPVTSGKPYVGPGAKGRQRLGAAGKITVD